MAKIKKAELREMVLKALMASDNTVKALSGDDNPQVLEMKYKAMGKRDAYSAVFDALVGCDDPLRCDSYR